jgi:tRNA threonylcarbamoyladenosine biosynthesis protein TsaE
MGEPQLSWELGSEEALAELAGRLAHALRRVAQRGPMVVGLRGDLGSGKTTFARAMLRALKFSGRVPSPTYTLLEQYACEDLAVIHLDLYRLRAEAEIENLGVRDWLTEARTLLLVEWPERAAVLLRRCDLVLELRVTGPSSRTVAADPKTPAGDEALGLLHQGAVNNQR